MIDLQKISGLPIELLDDGKIRFNPPLAATQKSWIRDRNEVASVLMDPSVEFDTTYWGYRQICLPEHKEIIEREHLQYDITVLPPLMYGEEFIKTVGHYH